MQQFLDLHALTDTWQLVAYASRDNVTPEETVTLACKKSSASNYFDVAWVANVRLDRVMFKSLSDVKKESRLHVADYLMVNCSYELQDDPSEAYIIKSLNAEEMKDIQRLCFQWSIEKREHVKLGNIVDQMHGAATREHDSLG